MRRLTGVLFVLVLAVACVGPKPQVRSAEVAPPENGTAKATVVITNDGTGDGQVVVKVTLREGDRVVGRTDKTTELKSRETLTLILEVDVPDDAGTLTVEAEVVYPPD